MKKLGELSKVLADSIHCRGGILYLSGAGILSGYRSEGEFKNSRCSYNIE